MARILTSTASLCAHAGIAKATRPSSVAAKIEANGYFITGPWRFRFGLDSFEAIGGAGATRAALAARSECQTCLKDFDGVKIELGIEGALNVGARAEPVLLPGKQEISDRRAAAAQHLDHGLGLIWRHHGIFVALEEDHRAGQTLGMKQRRALAVARLFLRVRADQPIEIA